jgi:uncharacterized membrane protein YidH (DUF202 family)
MGIGFGIGMLLVGLVLVMGVVNVDIPYVEDYQLGVILIILGILGIVLTMIAWNRARSARVVEERRIDGPPAP